MNFNTYNFDEILDEIVAERIRQDTKWGQGRFLSPIQWLPILVEEIGEFAQEICDDTDYRGNMRTELIQIAALTIAIMQDLDEQNPEGEREGW